VKRRAAELVNIPLIESPLHDHRWRRGPAPVYPLHCPFGIPHFSLKWKTENEKSRMENDFPAG
jgi:hypothetical protein